MSRYCEDSHADVVELPSIEWLVSLVDIVSAALCLEDSIVFKDTYNVFSVVTSWKSERHCEDSVACVHCIVARPVGRKDWRQIQPCSAAQRLATINIVVIGSRRAGQVPADRHDGRNRGRQGDDGCITTLASTREGGEQNVSVGRNVAYYAFATLVSILWPSRRPSDICITTASHTKSASRTKLFCNSSTRGSFPQHSSTRGSTRGSFPIVQLFPKFFASQVGDETQRHRCNHGCTIHSEDGKND